MRPFVRTRGCPLYTRVYIGSRNKGSIKRAGHRGLRPLLTPQDPRPPPTGFVCWGTRVGSGGRGSLRAGDTDIQYWLRFNLFSKQWNAGCARMFGLFVFLERDEKNEWIEVNKRMMYSKRMMIVLYENEIPYI